MVGRKGIQDDVVSVEMSAIQGLSKVNFLVFDCSVLMIPGVL